MSATPPTLVLVHGWGFDAGFWDPLRQALSGHDCVSIDLGFRGKKSPEPRVNGAAVGIGHSLGFLWLLKRRPFPWKALIAINGFPRFVEGDGFAPAAAPRLVERMIAKLEQEPDAVAADFLARCGSGERPRNLDPDRLREGLQWLLGWDGREALAGEKTPVMALAGRADPIVPAKMAEAAFAGLPGVTLDWHGGGHLLPRTAAGWCAERIGQCLSRL